MCWREIMSVFKINFLMDRGRGRITTKSGILRNCGKAAYFTLCKCQIQIYLFQLHFISNFQAPGAIFSVLLSCEKNARVLSIENAGFGILTIDLVFKKKVSAWYKVSLSQDKNSKFVFVIAFFRAEATLGYCTLSTVTHIQKNGSYHWWDDYSQQNKCK